MESNEIRVGNLVNFKGKEVERIRLNYLGTQTSLLGLSIGVTRQIRNTVKQILNMCMNYKTYTSLLQVKNLPLNSL